MWFGDRQEEDGKEDRKAILGVTPDTRNRKGRKVGILPALHFGTLLWIRRHFACFA